MRTISILRVNPCQMIPSLRREHFWSQDQQWKTYIHLSNTSISFQIQRPCYFRFVEWIIKCVWNWSNLSRLVKPWVKKLADSFHMEFFNYSDQKISWLHLFVGEMEVTFDQLPSEGMGWVQMKNGLFKCLECTRTFQHNRTARRHFKEKHAQSSKIECQYCSTTFCRKENLIRHISKFHNPSNIDQ